MKKAAIITAILLLAVAGYSCGSRGGRRSDKPTAIEARFPLRLSETDLSRGQNTIPLDKDAAARIDAVIAEFAASAADTSEVRDTISPHTDTHIATIRLEDPSHTVYVVLMHYFPPMSENVCGKVLFRDNLSGKFIDGTFDLRLYNLYNFEHGSLVPTNLKTELGIEAPELATADTDRDGRNEFETTTLVHNGTYNAERRIILTLKNGAVDTLSLHEKSLMNINYD